MFSSFGGTGGDPMDIDDDPFGGFSRGFGGGQAPRPKKQDKAIQHDLQVSLEDIFKGTTKKMKITRKVLNPDGRTTRNEDKMLTIDVKPGWKAGTKISFQKEGDQAPNTIPADIVFVIKDKPHPVYTRVGSDIKYKAKIGLREALIGTDLQVPTIDGRKIPIHLSSVTKPTTVKRIQGEGLPLPKQPTRRGDLLVEFDIQFPDRISDAAKRTLADTLPRTSF